MKTKILAVVLGVLLIAVNLFAADGDLIVGGNLGVGLPAGTSPGIKLDVNGMIRGLATDENPSNGTGVEMRYLNNSNMGVIMAYDRGALAYKDLGLGYGTGTQLFLKANGNVGIGTNNPTDKLEIYDGKIHTSRVVAANNYDTMISQFAYGGSMASKTQVPANSLIGGQLHYAYDGTTLQPQAYTGFWTNQAITGTAQSTWFVSTHFGYSGRKLAVDLSTGNVSIANLAGSSNNMPVYTTQGGVLTTSSSDSRMKINVENLGYGLSDVEKLRPVSFNWREDLQGRLGAQREIGLIAQEVREIIPEVVGTNNDQTLSVDYPKIISVLITAIKEQQKMIEDLKQAIEQIKAKQ